VAAPYVSPEPATFELRACERCLYVRRVKVFRTVLTAHDGRQERQEFCQRLCSACKAEDRACELLKQAEYMAKKAREIRQKRAEKRRR
jgi:hypothetical protein